MSRERLIERMNNIRKQSQFSQQAFQKDPITTLKKMAGLLIPVESKNNPLYKKLQTELSQHSVDSLFNWMERNGYKTHQDVILDLCDRCLGAINHGCIPGQIYAQTREHHHIQGQRRTSSRTNRL